MQNYNHVKVCSLFSWGKNEFFRKTPIFLSVKIELTKHAHIRTYTTGLPYGTTLSAAVVRLVAVLIGYALWKLLDRNHLPKSICWCLVIEIMNLRVESGHNPTFHLYSRLLQCLGKTRSTLTRKRKVKINAIYYIYRSLYEV